MAQHEDYQEVTLARSGLRPLRFRGREVWRWETSPDSAHPAYSGSPSRWRVLVLYQAEHGGYYLHDQQLTNWRGEHDHRAVARTALELFRERHALTGDEASPLRDLVQVLDRLARSQA